MCRCVCVCTHLYVRMSAFIYKDTFLMWPLRGPLCDAYHLVTARLVPRSCLFSFVLIEI